MDYTSVELDLLREKFRLSMRAYNTCKRNGFVDLECLIKYYKKHKDFSHLAKCGQMSSFELKKICEYYLQIFDVN